MTITTGGVIESVIKIFFTPTYVGKNECMFMMSMKLFSKTGECIASRPGVQVLGWDKYGHIVIIC